MIALPTNIDELSWLVNLEYDNNGIIANYRWCDADREILVTNDGTYLPRGPIAEIRGFNTAGSHLERREWFIIINDPNGTYKRSYERNWRRRRATISAWTNPGTITTTWKIGVCIGRQFVNTPEHGYQTHLKFAGLLSRVVSTKKRFMNNDAQRAVDSTDDSLSQAQITVDINWGGN